MSISANDYHLHLFAKGNTALPRRLTSRSQALNIALTGALTCVDVPLVNAGEEKKWQ